MSKNQSPLLLTVREVAILLRIHRPKVYDLIKAGIVEAFKLGSDWRIKRESLENMIGPIPADFFSRPRLKLAKSDDLPDEDVIIEEQRKVRAR